MAETDLSKIVGLIMENPALIEQIKNLGAESNKNESSKTDLPTPDAEEKEVTASVSVKESFDSPSRRKDLLCALKPYVSKERSRAIETMISIADILDMMKTR